MEDYQKMIEERQTIYGNASKLFGEVLRPVLAQFIQFTIAEPAKVFPWLMMLNKLIRALWSPNNLDHWIDIQGYAELIKGDINEKTNALSGK